MAWLVSQSLRQRLDRLGQSQTLEISLVSVAALGIFFIHLGTVALRDWDEGTVAQVAREIYRGGSLSDWWFPTLWGAPYHNKPPLMHGLIALSYHGFGVHEWAARFPGAVLTAASVPLLYWIGRELWTGRSSALWTAIVYVTLLPVVRHGRLAMLDGGVVFFFLIFLGSLLRSRRHPPWFWGIALGLAGMGLTKGLLAVLLLGLGLLFISVDTPRILKKPGFWASVGFGLAPTALWYLSQGYHWGWQSLGIGLGDQGVARIWTTVEKNDGSPLYYLGELLKYSWPWLLFLPWALGRIWHDRHLSHGKLLLIWGGGYLTIISIMGTKLPWYIFPLYPALALILGQFLAHVWTRCGGWGGYAYTPYPIPNIWPGFLGFLALVTTLGVIYFSPLGPDPSLGIQLSLGWATLAFGLASYWSWRRCALFLPVLAWGWYLALLTLMATPQWLWELGEDYPVKPVAALIQDQVPPGIPVYTSHTHGRPSLDFYSDRPILPLPAEQLEKQWALASPGYFLVHPDQATNWAQESQSLGSAEQWVLVTPKLQP